MTSGAATRATLACAAKAGRRAPAYRPRSTSAGIAPNQAAMPSRWSVSSAAPTGPPRAAAWPVRLSPTRTTPAAAPTASRRPRAAAGPAVAAMTMAAIAPASASRIAMAYGVNPNGARGSKGRPLGMACPWLNATVAARATVVTRPMSATNASAARTLQGTGTRASAPIQARWSSQTTTVPARRRAATVASQRAAIPSGSGGVVGSVGMGSVGAPRCRWDRRRRRRSARSGGRLPRRRPCTPRCTCPARGQAGQPGSRGRWRRGSGRRHRRSAAVPSPGSGA